MIINPYAFATSGPGSFATWSPTDHGSGVVLTNSNLTLTAPGSGYANTRSTIGKTTGKWYWEVAMINMNSGFTGICDPTAALFSYPGSDTHGYGYRLQNGDVFKNSAPFVSGFATFSNGDVCGVALDAGGNTVQFYKNGVAQGSPIAMTGLSGGYFAAFAQNFSGGQITANFGASAFAYTVPSGFNPGLY